MVYVNKYTVGFIIILIILSIIFYNSVKIEFFSTIVPKKDVLDSVSGNNMLTAIITSPCSNCDGKELTSNNIRIDNVTGEIHNHGKVVWESNQDCKLNPEYHKSMCLQRQGTKNSKLRMCKSITGIVPRPQNSLQPTNFEDF